MISKENKENKTREEELKENISYIGKALGIEEEKEVKEEKNIEKEFPNLPEKSAMTWKNTDIKTVSELLGHSDIETTNIYVHALETSKRDAVLNLQRKLS